MLKVKCQRVMDRMIVLGLLYKDGKDYNLTIIGEKFTS